jgi:hypothetical protein
LQACIEFAFAIFPKPAAFFEPSEGTLDNPMLGNDSKPVKLVALGDFDRRAEYLEDCRGKGFADRLNRPGNPGGSNI